MSSSSSSMATSTSTSSTYFSLPLFFLSVFRTALPPVVVEHPYALFVDYGQMTYLFFIQRKAAAKTEKARKGKKDPAAPKRALSAYMFFSQDWRERVKAENPDASFGKSFVFTAQHVKLICSSGEVGKLLGAKWKELDDGEKKVRMLVVLYVFPVLTRLEFSRTRTKRRLTRAAQKRRRRHTMLVSRLLCLELRY